MALISDTGGSSLSSHDHRLSAVTVWYVAFPFGPATAGRVAVASMTGNERRIQVEAMRRVAEKSMQEQN